MKQRNWLALTLFVLCATAVYAGETVGVSGCGVRFPTTIVGKDGKGPVKLRLTGVALRKKLFFNVYALGSYLAEGATARNAEQLASVEALKQLHLVMQRDVDGEDMAAAFRDAVRLNHAEPAFHDELKQLCTYMAGMSARKGDYVLVTSWPGVGLHVTVVGKSSDVLIKNPAFARAVWEIYLGPNNLGEEIKQGLVSRL